MSAYSKYKSKHNLCLNLLFSLLLIFIILSNCATVGINNYQNAETLGKRKFKIGQAFELGREMEAGIKIDEGEIHYKDKADWEEKMGNFVFPILEFSGQYGITNSTDIGLNYTFGGASMFMKQNLLHTPNDFAIAIMPRAGIFGSESETSIGIEGEDYYTEQKDKYKGTQFDISIIISKRWKFFSVFLSPKFLYNNLSIKTDYKAKRGDQGTIRKNDKKTFIFHTYGSAAGISFAIKNFTIIPEISYLRVKDLPLDKYSWVVFPGLGFTVKF